MRSTSFLVTCGAAVSITLSGTHAVPLSSIADGFLPAAFKPSLLSSKSPSTGAILESLRILPDDDQDGLVDVTGQLKALSDGELLDLNGRVKIAGLIDTCIDIVVDGKPTRRCGRQSKSRKHRFHGGLRDDWSKDEHRRCSNHFRAWHRHHDKKDCSDELAQLRERVAQLEDELKSCRGSDSNFRPNDFAVKTVKHHDHDDSSSQHTDDPRDGEDNNNNDDDDDKKWTWTDQNGKTWRNEALDCKNGIYTYTDKDGIVVKACIKAKIDVLGVATAEAEIQATATVDLAKGQVHATAKANAKVEAGPIKAESKNDVKADVDLKKGEADIKVKSDDVVKVGNQKIVDTGLQTEVGLNKKQCEKGATLNIAGLCVKASLEKQNLGKIVPAGPLGSTDATGPLLGNALKGARII